jgi:hypothetical protein
MSRDQDKMNDMKSTPKPITQQAPLTAGLTGSRTDFFF